MSEESYPIKCQSQSCSKLQYGPVKYCPYCGFLTPAVEEIPEKVEVGQVPEESAVTPTSSEIVSQKPISKPELVLKQTQTPIPEKIPQPTVETPVKQPEKEITSSELKSTAKKDETLQEEKKPVLIVPPQPEPKPDTKPGNLKWVVVAVVLVAVVVVGYLFSHKKGQGPADTSVSQQSSDTPTSTSGPRDSARILALDALRKGTDLSVSISKIPKLEKVLEAAKKLGEISPRYQDQITSAESTVSAARNDRDKNLLAYIGKVSELGRYTPEQISYAMGVIKNGDLTSREKKVAELLTEHVSASRNNNKADPEKLLSDFNRSFSDFVE